MVVIADFQRDPIPHGGQFRIRFRLVIDLAAHHDLKLFPLPGQGSVADFVIANQPRRHPAFGRAPARLPFLCKGAIPTQILQRHATASARVVSINSRISERP